MNLSPSNANIPPLNQRGRIASFFSLLRVKQWAKNAFVLVPFFFSFRQHCFHGLDYGLLAYAFGVFCFLSSAVYCLNDVLDKEKDRQHPRKCQRPVASGRISSSAAMITGCVLAITSVIVGVGLNISFTAIKTRLAALLCVGIVYLLNNILYSIVLRRYEVIDVFSIAAGFVLRLLAGCFALDIVPSHWLLVCGFSLALFLGFGKRRAEIAQNSEGKTNRETFRESLRAYSPDFLNILLAVTATITLLSYMLYCISPETAALHQTRNLIYTVPFVFFGVFRYVAAVLAGSIDGPDELLFGDKLFLVNIILWAATTSVILAV